MEHSCFPNQEKLSQSVMHLENPCKSTELNDNQIKHSPQWRTNEYLWSEIKSPAQENSSWLQLYQMYNHF